MGAATAPADGNREQRLEATLRRLRHVVGILADELDLDPGQCVVTVAARSAGIDRQLASVSLADCLAEADLLIGTSGPSLPG